MDFYSSRYDAKKACPNGIVRKVLRGNWTGQYATFYDLTTYQSWKSSGMVK
jgi:hypothetical protein